jgi:hypothetical protein
MQHAAVHNPPPSRALPPFEATPHTPPARPPTRQHPQSSDVVQMQIGYHLIEGKKIPLKKPVAILEKRTSSSSSSGRAAAGMEVDGESDQAAAAGSGDDGQQQDQGACQYEVRVWVWLCVLADVKERQHARRFSCSSRGGWGGRRPARPLSPHTPDTARPALNPSPAHSNGIFPTRRSSAWSAASTCSKTAPRR